MVKILKGNALGKLLSLFDTFEWIIICQFWLNRQKGLITNSGTLFYIFKSFDIKVHVYTLLFVDTLISTIGNFIVLNLYILKQTPLVDVNTGFCSALFFALFLPTLYGAILICLVAVVRLTLAMRAAKNIQIPNRTVSAWTLSAFGFFVLLSGSYIVVHIALDEPIIPPVEVCAKMFREPRPGLMSVTKFIVNKRTFTYLELRTVNTII